jgi:hypothetical protein
MKKFPQTLWNAQVHYVADKSRQLVPTLGQHHHTLLISEPAVLSSKHYATSRKFAGSIPDEVIEFFNLPNPSGRTMALEYT